MELNSFYLPDEIIDVIYNTLDHNDKFSFSCINSYTRKYKDNIKKLTFEYINKDYKIFKDCFKRYTYTNDELLSLGILAVRDIHIIWGTALTRYYDLRYLFELIYAGLNIDDKLLIQNIKALNLKFLMDEIKSCISFNRYETINNVNKKTSLFSLKVLFEPFYSAVIGKKEWTLIN